MNSPEVCYSMSELFSLSSSSSSSSSHSHGSVYLSRSSKAKFRFLPQEGDVEQHGPAGEIKPQRKSFIQCCCRCFLKTDSHSESFTTIQSSYIFFFTHFYPHSTINTRSGLSLMVFLGDSMLAVPFSL